RHGWRAWNRARCSGGAHAFARRRSSRGHAAGDRMRRVLRLRVGVDSLRGEAGNGVVEWAGEAAYGGLGDLTDAIGRLASEGGHGCKRIEVAIERPLVQLRTLSDLPRVPERALVELVALQSRRFFRRNGKPLVVDAVWVGKGVAHAAAVEEPLVDAISAGARAAGLELNSIAPAEAGVGLSLLPRAETAARRRSARPKLRLYAGFALMLWVSLGVAYL